MSRWLAGLACCGQRIEVEAAAGDGLGANEIGFQRVQMFHFEIAGLYRHGTRRRRLAGADCEQIAAELGNVGLHLLGRAGTDGDHCDDGRNADNDAEQGQE